MATATTKLLTAEDLLRLNSQGVKGELIRGVLCETVSVGEEHGHIAGIFITYLNVHIRPQRLGRAGGTDVGVLIQRDPAMVREPDVYYVSTERLPLNIRVRGYLEVAPELVAPPFAERPTPSFNSPTAHAPSSTTRPPATTRTTVASTASTGPSSTAMPGSASAWTSLPFPGWP
jgi:hypothetical protein